MSSATESRQATMDTTQLYREDIFTDRKVGTIRRLTPVTKDGSDDAARPVLFVGQAQIMTPMGAVPISFELESTTLDGAVEKFGPAAELAVQQTMREIQEMRREQASSLVIPDAGGAEPCRPLEPRRPPAPLAPVILTGWRCRVTSPPSRTRANPIASRLFPTLRPTH